MINERVYLFANRVNEILQVRVFSINLILKLIIQILFDIEQI